MATIMSMEGNMSAKEALERSFKQLVLTTPYDKITISEICRNAHLSRKTFYANFEGKEDIVAKIFEEGAVQPIRLLNRTLTTQQAANLAAALTENIYTYLERERDYYKKLVGPPFDRNDTFRKVATECIAQLDREILDVTFNVSEMERDYAACYFGASQAAICEKWIMDDMPIPATELAALYKKFTSSYWGNFLLTADR